MASTPRTERVLARIRDVVAPEIYLQISARLQETGADDNQNQNSGLTDELASLKPAVLREIAITSHTGTEAMDNQNQNQGKLAELLHLKPEVLRQLRTTLRGEAVMDNQNQNQGTQAQNKDLGAKPILPGEAR
jgi:hypothetical protein